MRKSIEFTQILILKTSQICISLPKNKNKTRSESGGKSTKFKQISKNQLDHHIKITWCNIHFTGCFCLHLFSPQYGTRLLILQVKCNVFIFPCKLLHESIWTAKCGNFPVYYLTLSHLGDNRSDVISLMASSRDKMMEEQTAKCCNRHNPRLCKYFNISVKCMN